VTLHHARCMLCSIAFGASALAAGNTPGAVTAIIVPEGHYSRPALQEMGREAGRLLKDSGVTLRWQLATSAQDIQGLLIVVELHGNCDMDEAIPELKPGPLGSSYKVRGSLLPFGDLACDRIRGAVQSAHVPESRLPANLLLGRAMGRVLAHELYHIIADTSKHGSEGVAQKALSSRELASGQIDLEPADAELVRSALQRLR